MDLGQIIAYLTSGAALAGFGAALNGWIKAKSDAKTAERKIVSEVNLAEDAQEFSQVTILFTDLRNRIITLEQANADCVSDRIKLHHEIGKLEGRLDEQNAAMQHIRTANVQQNREALKAAGVLAAEGVKAAAQLALSDSATRLAEALATPQKTVDKATDPDIDSIH